MTATYCSTPGFPVLHYLPECAQIHVHWVGDAIQPSHPLLPLLLLPSIFPNTRVFSNESALIEVIELKWVIKVGPSPIRPVSLWKREAGPQAHVHTLQGRQCEEMQDEGKYLWVRLSPHSPQKESILPTPWFWTSSLQNTETIHICCLSLPVCGTALWHNTGPAPKDSKQIENNYSRGREQNSTKLAEFWKK